MYNPLKRRRLDYQRAWRRAKRTRGAVKSDVNETSENVEDAIENDNIEAGYIESDENGANEAGENETEDVSDVSHDGVVLGQEIIYSTDSEEFEQEDSITDREQYEQEDSTDSEEVYQKPDGTNARQVIAAWAVRNNITHNALDDLLRGLHDIELSCSD